MSEGRFQTLKKVQKSNLVTTILFRCTRPTFGHLALSKC
jgi:hypothetical protein